MPPRVAFQFRWLLLTRAGKGVSGGMARFHGPVTFERADRADSAWNLAISGGVTVPELPSNPQYMVTRVGYCSSTESTLTTKICAPSLTAVLSVLSLENGRWLAFCACYPSSLETPCATAQLPCSFLHSSVRFSAAHLTPDFSLFQDAHNCIPELDSETAMFSVYDGHGGNGILCLLPRVLQPGSSGLLSGC